MIDDARYATLVEAASAPYRKAGRIAWYFARGKLRWDPVFRRLAEGDLVPEGARVLDLGCGQGLVAALLVALGTPQLGAYRGLDLLKRDVARARNALGAACDVRRGDIRHMPFGEADVVILLDVLHYLAPAEQDDVLVRSRSALASGGCLLVRVADADAGLRFRISTALDSVAAMLRGFGVRGLHCRSVAKWCAALEGLGFAVRAEPMSRGTPFANVLLDARLAQPT
ncbi:MAG: class I SAM-dependent methyltransferase [Burkholderiales bacterium]